MKKKLREYIKKDIKNFEDKWVRKERCILRYGKSFLKYFKDIPKEIVKRKFD